MKRDGASVTLIAPERPGAALVGPGPADVDRLLDWGSPRLARLFGGAPPAPLPLDEVFDLAVAYTRNTLMVERLTAWARDVRQWDPEPPPNQGHASLWLAQPMTALGFPADVAPPVQTPTEEESAMARAIAARLPRGFFAIHPGSGSPTKNWPARRYAELLRRVSPDRPWLLIEGPADAAAAALLYDVPGVVRLPETPVRVLGALLSCAGAYVGNDSGISHVAAAWGAPTVALFGPTSPEVWGPQGPIVEVLLGDTSDVATIPIESVAAAVTRVRSAALERPCG